MEYLQLEFIEKTICSKWHFDSLYPLNKYWVLATWIPDSSYLISDLSYSGFQSLVGFRTLNSTSKYFWDSGSHKQNVLGSQILQAKIYRKSFGGSRGGARGALLPPPLFLDKTEARRVEKSLGDSAPLLQGVDDRAPPYLKVSRSGTSTEINIITIQPELDMTLRENHTLIERVAYGMEIFRRKKLRSFACR